MVRTELPKCPVPQALCLGPIGLERIECVTRSQPPGPTSRLSRSMDPRHKAWGTREFRVGRYPTISQSSGSPRFRSRTATFPNTSYKCFGASPNPGRIERTLASVSRSPCRTSATT